MKIIKTELRVSDTSEKKIVGPYFVGEHNSIKLEISLFDEFADAGASYRVLCFQPEGSGKKIYSNNIYTAHGQPYPTSYFANGVLHFPVSSELLNTRRLDVQLEVHWQDEGEISKILKSGIFTVLIEPSITGTEKDVSEDVFDNTSRLLAALDEAEKMNEKLSKNLMFNEEGNLELKDIELSENPEQDDNSRKIATTHFVKQATDWKNISGTTRPSIRSGSGEKSVICNIAGEGDSSGQYSYSEGYRTFSHGLASHAEGYDTVSANNFCHSEGHTTAAEGLYSHAEGIGTRAYANGTHTENYYSKAYAAFSHAGGNNTSTEGEASFAHGTLVKATNNSSAIFGRFGTTNRDSIFAVANGDSPSKEFLAFEIYKKEIKLNLPAIGVTPAVGDNSNLVATTAFVKSEIDAYAAGNPQADGHIHNNLETIEEFSVDGEGNLLFGGERISFGEGQSGSVGYAETFAQLPQEAIPGSIAFVGEDSVYSEEISNQDIAMNTVYPYLSIKNELSDDLLDSLNNALDGYGILELSLCRNRGSGSEKEGAILLYSIEGGIKFLVFVNLKYENYNYAYFEDENKRCDSKVFIYNFTPGFEISSMGFNVEPAQLDIGWYASISGRGNYRFEDGRTASDEITTVESVDIKESLWSRPFQDCFLCIGNDNDLEIADEAALSEILSGIFNKSAIVRKKKGLYVFNDGWKRVENGELDVYGSVLELPGFPEEGEIAFVKNSKTIYSKDPYETFYEGRSINSIYLNPLPAERNFLFDFEVGGYIYDNSGTQQFDGGFELVTNAEEGYALLSLPIAATYSMKRYLIYSNSDQSIALDADTVENTSGVQIDMRKGWNTIYPDSNGGIYEIKHHEDYTELPDVVNCFGDSMCRFIITHCKIPEYSNNAYIEQSIISTRKVCDKDNAAGLWGFYNNEWQKLEDNLIYINKVN